MATDPTSSVDATAIAVNPRRPALAPAPAVPPLLRPEARDFAQQLIKDGVPDNTRRAYQRDIEYYWAWAAAIAGEPVVPSYPLPMERIVEFISDHLETMPAAAEALLTAPRNGVRGQVPIKRKVGSHKLSTLRRRLASLSAAHRILQVENPVASSEVKLLLRSARHKFANSAASTNKKHALLADTILNRILPTCEDTLRGIRDKALILVGFATGGRRVSELAAFKVEDLQAIVDPNTYRKHYLLTLRRSKTDQSGVGKDVPVKGDAADALSAWLAASGIKSGQLFRGVTRGGTLRNGLCARSISQIVKHRCIQAGLDALQYSAHSLRSGFMTESGRRGVHMGDAMALSLHASYQIALGYYQSGMALNNPAADLLDGDVTVGRTFKSP